MKKVLSIKDNNQHYLSKFQELTGGTNGEAAWLHEIRTDAINKFDQLGFPTTRNEEWKYTNIEPLAKKKFKHQLKPMSDKISEEVIDRFSYNNIECNLLLFVNGCFVPELSRIDDLPDGVIAGSLSDAIHNKPELLRDNIARYAKYGEDAFTALSTAFIHDGAFLNIPDDVEVKTPFHLLFLSPGNMQEFAAYPRNFIYAGKRSNVSIIETYGCVENNEYFTNTVTEIVTDEEAKVEHFKIQEESKNAYHISTMHVKQKKGSDFASNAATFGGLIVRNNPIAELDGEGIESTLNGLYLGTGSQLIDNHTTIDHVKPHCNSYELYKGILDDCARGVFNGKIFVRRDAQKTDAKQTNQALLLSDEASIDTKPQLEIFADDVKCTHGATIGQLDKNALFYLRARGVEAKKAENILTYAFASDLTDRISIKELREYLHRRILSKLRQEDLAGIETT